MTLESAEFWLRAQAGHRMVPAAYLHFADALLRSMQGPSRRHWGVRRPSGRVVALAFAVATDASWARSRQRAVSLHLTPGPFFWRSPVLCGDEPQRLDQHQPRASLCLTPHRAAA